LTECGDLSEVEAGETAMAAVAVKMAEAIEMAAVTITTVALTVKMATMTINVVTTLRTAVMAEAT
jgi:hypothetical protein